MMGTVKLGSLLNNCKLKYVYLLRCAVFSEVFIVNTSLRGPLNYAD